jgi:hypothetical protein
MGRLHGGAVQQAFANPVLACGVAVRLAACGDLGHIDHCLDTGFAGRLGENGDGVEQAGSNRVTEIRSRDPSQCRADSMEVEKITDNDLSPVRGQALGTRVAAVDKGSDTVPTLKQQAHRGVTRVPGRSRDQEHSGSLLGFGGWSPGGEWWCWAVHGFLHWFFLFSF